MGCGCMAEGSSKELCRKGTRVSTHVNILRKQLGRCVNYTFMTVA